MDPIRIPIDVTEQDDAKLELSPTGLELLESNAAMPKQMILITQIAREPAIFNPRHDDYRNPLMKDDLWIKIGKQVGWTDQQCKNKWKALRDQYCRELKRARTNSNAVIKWKYFQHLQFLRPYALYRNYRPKMSTRQAPKEPKEETNQQEEEMANFQDDNLCSTLKTEDWTMGSNSSPINESTDIASQIMVQMTHSVNNPDMDDEPQDDEDDDPIHTFLNIESYFEKQLIAIIKSEEVLYNSKHPWYRNAKMKLRVWEEIARKLKKTVRQCRLKWKALRDQYIREHKRILYMNNGKSMPRWKHYDALGFLEKFTRQRGDYNTMIIQKPELQISIEQLDQEQIITPPTEEDQEMTQYNLGDDVSSQIFADCGHTKRSSDEEQHNDLPVEEPTDDNDEVGAFFRAIAMKIRKANMSAVTFTELQIDILRVITNALRNH